MSTVDKIFTFEIPGPCVPKGAPRAHVIIKNGKPKARIHKDAKTEKWIKHVSTVAFAKFHPRKPWNGPVALIIEVYRRLLVEHENSARKRSDAINGRFLPITKPDLDNYCKGIADALSGVVYIDDAQIVTLMMTKRYSLSEKTIVTVKRENQS
jgi:Holliday junction resolvase RusA-like endonuclease